MKTLNEIIEICQNGDTPDINDARFAICALRSLITFDSLHLRYMAQKEIDGKGPGLFTPKRNYEEHFNRLKTSLTKSPIEWLGDSNNPDNPDVQKRRKISHKIVDKILKKNKSIK